MCDFLKKYALTSVSCEEANGLYSIRHERVETGMAWKEIETVQTDGEIIHKGKKQIKKGKDKWTSFQMIEITNATWVIVTTIEENGEKCKILYTLFDPTLIKGLPLPVEL